MTAADIPSDGPVILIRPDNGYLVSQPLSEDPNQHEMAFARFPGVCTLRLDADRTVAVLLPGALENTSPLVAAVRGQLRADHSDAYAALGVLEASELIEDALAALGAVLGVPATLKGRASDG
jgi:hypothetical protein